VVRCSPEAIDRVRTRAKVPPGQHSPYAYTDRQGKLQLPFDEALELAQKFCAAEPQAVLAGVEATEREWARDARTPGEEHMVPLLNEYRAAWALIRQWTGHDPAVAAREEEIQKLERLVWDAIYALQKAGLDSEAARLVWRSSVLAASSGGHTYSAIPGGCAPSLAPLPPAGSATKSSLAS